MAAPMLNFNIGVLGHIDSGKTSLCKALSTIESTASFDKNPQSKERGITLDLGFSSFSVDFHLLKNRKNPHDDSINYQSTLGTEKLPEEKLQYTLVDCPGHASLIRTIIGGAQIIDLMMLVLDITKGMQTQTAECLVIGQITCKKMVVVLNKVDLVPEVKRQATIEKIGPVIDPKMRNLQEIIGFLLKIQMTKRILKTLESTCFSGCAVVSVAARPGGPEGEGTDLIGIDKLITVLQEHTHLPDRSDHGPFVCSVDHCFSIKGQGTVMTGTALSGSITVGQTVEIPALKITKKIKSMQIFRKPVQSAMQGDRVAICVTQFDPRQLERGLICSSGALPTISAAIVKVQRIPYFKQNISTKAKFHITLGHDTVMGKAIFFSDTEAGCASFDKIHQFNFDCEYKYENELSDGNSEDNTQQTGLTHCFAVLELERPVTCPADSLVIGSRLDADVHTTSCRLGFHGRILQAITDDKHKDTILPNVKVYKMKSREGVVERKVDNYTCVCKGLFKKESNLDAFIGLKVQLSTGENGVIEGSFGQSGKFKIAIPDGLSPEVSAILDEKQKKSKNKCSEPTFIASTPAQVITVKLIFKRYIYDTKKRMHQK